MKASVIGNIVGVVVWAVVLLFVLFASGAFVGIFLEGVEWARQLY